MYIIRTRCLSLFAVTWLATRPSDADQILVIDGAAATFALCGSDTGTPKSIFGEVLVEWSLTGLGGGGSTYTSDFDNDEAWSTTFGSPGNIVCCSDPRDYASSAQG